MKIGDLIIYRKIVSWGKKAFYGIVIDLHGLDAWAEILWSDGQLTWEDIEASAVDAFEVINEASKIYK